MSYEVYTRHMSKASEKKFMAMCYCVVNYHWMPDMEYLDLIEACEEVFHAWTAINALTDKQREEVNTFIQGLRCETTNTIKDILSEGWCKYTEVNHCD